MFDLREYRRGAAALADFLPWAALVGPGLILNKDGAFQRTARFRGPDLDSATPAELIGAAGRLNNALRRLGSGWAIFVEAQRNPAETYPVSDFPDAVSRLVDEERRADFEQAGAHFESAYYLTFVYLPPPETAGLAEAWLYEGRLSLHVGDVGHTLVVGPTGAGKSVLLALLALQFRRYSGAQIFAFDFGGSIRAAALAMGGDFHDLGGALAGEGVAGDPPVALQPLARADEAAERAWAAEWLAALLSREGIVVSPEVKEHLWTALGSLGSAPVGERTLTGLCVLLQSNVLKRALQPYTLAGAWGRLLDAEVERIGAADVQAFETEGLVGSAAAPAVLSYLFHRVEGRLTGRPTLVIVDEGWLALDDPTFGAQLREWLKTLRKKNAAVVFATQSLADIETSAIAAAIVESCPTRIFLPNERAIEPQITAVYRRFGLNDRQIEILSRATPKRDYYCQSRRGNRLFELGLGPVGLALTAASTKTDQTKIAELLAAHGPGGFAAAWLVHRGLGWAADFVRPVGDHPASFHPNLESVR